MGKLKARSGQASGAPEGDPRQREAWEQAERVFWCNTNREGGPGGNVLEQRMHARRFAAAWTSFNYPTHMQRVECGDVIVMYANGLGVIGIGRATERGLEILNRNHRDRMRDYATEGNNQEEWRIPVEWLVWDDSNPCRVDFLRPTFQEITHLAPRVRAVTRHHWNR
jgi:hypothetical protein